jgi:hypothetical protein
MTIPRRREKTGLLGLDQALHSVSRPPYPQEKRVDEVKAFLSHLATQSSTIFAVSLIRLDNPNSRSLNRKIFAPVAQPDRATDFYPIQHLRSESFSRNKGEHWRYKPTISDAHNVNATSTLRASSTAGKAQAGFADCKSLCPGVIRSSLEHKRDKRPTSQTAAKTVGADRIEVSRTKLTTTASNATPASLGAACYSPSVFGVFVSL